MGIDTSLTPLVPAELCWKV